jgi:hypothetical protein
LGQPPNDLTTNVLGVILKRKAVKYGSPFY